MVEIHNSSCKLTYSWKKLTRKSETWEEPAVSFKEADFLRGKKLNWSFSIEIIPILATWGSC